MEQTWNPYKVVEGAGKGEETAVEVEEAAGGDRGVGLHHGPAEHQDHQAELGQTGETAGQRERQVEGSGEGAGGKGENDGEDAGGEEGQTRHAFVLQCGALETHLVVRQISVYQVLLEGGQRGERTENEAELAIVAAVRGLGCQCGQLLPN